MTCRDFQHKWNELLDADSRRAGARNGAADVAPTAIASQVDEDEASLLAHAAACPDCQLIAARYQVLRQAIQVWRQPPTPPADLVRRVLSTPADDFVRPWRRKLVQSQRETDPIRYRRLMLGGFVVSLAGCALMAITIAYLDRSRSRPRGVTTSPTAHVELHSIAPAGESVGDAPALNRALADVTSATWDLARSAAEPAARISRGMIDAATTDGSTPDHTPTGSTSVTSTGSADGLSGLGVVPSLDRLAPDPTSVLQEVGGRLSAGVRPLSTTARQAFGFLLGPDREPAEPPATAPKSS